MCNEDKLVVADVTLKDGTKFRTGEFLLNKEFNRQNDNAHQNSFFIGNKHFKKDDVSLIDIIELEDVESESKTTVNIEAKLVNEEEVRKAIETLKEELSKLTLDVKLKERV